jgi:large subunit ribosomal protein L19
MFLYDMKKNLLENIRDFEKEYEKKVIPNIRVGDTARLGIKIVEGKTERIQFYEGVVIGVKNTSIKKTILVRRIFQGFGMERIFVLHSPLITSIEIKRSAKVRRAKLYYLRKLSGKAARLKKKIN